MADPMSRLILASGSAYRRELLSRIVDDFASGVPSIDETPLPDERPPELAARLALAKARACAEADPDATVIGSDQVAALGNQILGKPGNHATARRQLQACSGREVEFHTAVVVVSAARQFERKHIDLTTVCFRELDDALVDAYLLRDQPYDCAGSFKAERAGVVLFEQIRSNDPTGLIGLPLVWLAGCLRDAGIELL